MRISRKERPFSVRVWIRSAFVWPCEFSRTPLTQAAPELDAGVSSSRRPGSWSSQGSERLM